MERAELEALLGDLESDRVERKATFTDKEKICRTICAFANDMPGHKRPGVLFIGVDDTGRPTGLRVTDELLREPGGIRSEGKIQPLPALTVSKETFGQKDVMVVLVQPAQGTPVRYDGRTWVRVGPRLALATPEEERRLVERRRAAELTFDQEPAAGATVQDLDLRYFREVYLPQAVPAEVLRDNQRGVQEQLAALRLVGPDFKTPTFGGLLVLGVDPLAWRSGAYVQSVTFDGVEVSAPIASQMQIDGRLGDVGARLDEFLPLHIQTARVPVSALRQGDVPDYPWRALRELVFNALIHRNYGGSNAPVRIMWFSDRVEISNPGGLYGVVTSANFHRMTDYRNPVLAQAMKALGFVERFGVGIGLVRRLLQENGNAPPEFHFEPEYALVIVRKRQ
jgi:ATP-dependent DNA helicase RecG